MAALLFVFVPLVESLRAALKLFADAILRDAMDRRRAELPVFGALPLFQRLPFLNVAGDIGRVFGLESLF